MVFENALDGVAPEDVAEIAKSTAEPRVAPSWVLRRELHQHLFQPDGRAWTTEAAFGRAVVFVGNQVAIPAQDSVRRQQAGDLLEPFPAKHLAPRCEPSALIICEPQPAATHLLAQNSILFFEVVDHLELLPIDPAGEQQEQELQRLAGHVEPSHGATLERIRRDSFQLVRRNAFKSRPLRSILFRHRTRLRHSALSITPPTERDLRRRHIRRPVL